MDLLAFAALAVGYALSTWSLLRQSRVPRAPWEASGPSGWVIRPNVGSRLSGRDLGVVSYMPSGSHRGVPNG
jgi:hypothetical protein